MSNNSEETISTFQEYVTFMIFLGNWIIFAFVEEEKNEKKIEKASSPRKKLFSLEFDFFELNADEIFSRLGP